MADELPIQFYFDFISPYAYLAWKNIGHVAQAHGRPVQPIPILFAGILKELDHKGPVEILSKRIHTYKNVVRVARDAHIPIKPPATGHPFNSLSALRICCLDLQPTMLHRIIDRFFDAAWRGGEGITDGATLVKILTDEGLLGEELFEVANAGAIKERLKQNTDDALERGVFGVPTMIVPMPDGSSELFWGFDALPHVDAYLAGKDPLSQIDFEPWKNLEAQSARKEAREREEDG